MYHHDARDYHKAVAETEERFNGELQAIIAKGQASAANVIQKIQDEIPEDAILHSKQVKATVDSKAVGNGISRIVRLSEGEWSRPLHNHALSQVAARTGVPELYVNRLMEKDYGPDLLAHNLNTIFEKEQAERYLARTVKGEVRGLLSDKYRRMDSRPILEAFVAGCQSVRAVPVEGVGGDLRFEIKALLPIVFRPGGDEIVAFGIALSNSDFGCGALSVRLFCLRIWCTNYAKMEEELRKVHLGSRLGDEIQYSAETYRADTRAMALATRDIVKGVLGPAKVNAQVAMIEKAMESKIELKTALRELPKMGLLKGEVEAVEETFRTGGVEKLPPGDTTYRLSNAVSWIAKAATTAERRMELEQTAGQILAKAA
jgi:hypothetical protein